MLKVLSLGWGVQSFTLAAMSALGELTTLDYAIHSDTTWERESTYEFAAKWTPWLEERGVKVLTACDWKAAKAPVNSAHNLLIPAFIRKGNAKKRGQYRRQCTHRWKIIPLRRELRKIMKEQNIKIGKSPVVEQWLGISKDEWTRARNSDVKYIEHRFPLLENKMTRQDCIIWLEDHGLEVPGKSSCTHCVYHSQPVWEQMRKEGGKDWEQAVRFDEIIRNKSTVPTNTVYLHPSLKPLVDAVGQQPSLWDETPGCDSAGYCWA